MPEFDQQKIIQEIMNRALSVIESGWRELIMNYYVDELQSDFGNSYLIEEGGEIKEKPLPFAEGLDDSFRKLRSHLAQGGKPPFASCKLYVRADGKFDASYGYEKINWDALLEADWNFLPNKK